MHKMGNYIQEAKNREDGGNCDYLVQYVFNIESMRCRKMMEETRFLNMERHHHGVEFTVDNGRSGQNVHYLFTNGTERKNLEEELMDYHGSIVRKPLNHGY